jgi:hypothetical protein
MQDKPSELVNPESHNHPQHHALVDLPNLNVESTNLESINSSIEKVGWNQLIEELVKDIKEKIQKVEYPNSFVPLPTPLNSKFAAVHLYLATVIDFLTSRKIIDNEIIRQLFKDDMCLSWIIELNILHLIEEFTFSFLVWAADVTNQWFWTLKWNFLKGMFLHELLVIDEYVPKLIEYIIL